MNSTASVRAHVGCALYPNRAYALFSSATWYVVAFVLLLSATCQFATAATIVDLTSVGASGIIEGAIYEQIDPKSTGTGVIDSFAQVQAQGNGDTESGYNTTVNNTLDNGAPNNFNHAISLGDVPIVNIDDVDYREFILDVNEADQGPKDNRLISLDEVQVFVGGTPNSSVTTLDGGGILEHDGTLVYHMDANMDNWVALDFQLNSGSGSGDMRLLIPASNFSGFSAADTVVLYSEFGLQGVNPSDGMGGTFVGDFGASAGFEEWALREPNSTHVPEPATPAMLLGSMLGLLIVRRWAA